MQRAITVTAVIVVILTGIGLKFTVPPSTAHTSELTGSVQNRMSIYDLHVGYPNLKSLPAQEAPLP